MNEPAGRRGAGRGRSSSRRADNVEKHIKPFFTDQNTTQAHTPIAPFSLAPAISVSSILWRRYKVICNHVAVRVLESKSTEV
jgi:hypothetical protein